MNIAELDKGICFRHEQLKENIDGALVCRTCYEIAVGCVIELRTLAFENKIRQNGRAAYRAEQNGNEKDSGQLVTETFALIKAKRELENIKIKGNGYGTTEI